MFLRRSTFPRCGRCCTGNPKSEVRQFPDLNFLLQTADTGLGREAVWAEETIAPVVLEAIGDWILKSSR